MKKKLNHDRAGHHCPVRTILSGLCPTIYGQK
jgi:hypothetical protein